MGIFAESLYDAVLDCLKTVPILFLAYLLISWLSHDHSRKFSKLLLKNKKVSVFYASFLGCVPQCGFSSVLADLYADKKVSLGTIIAVFVATSDEAIPIMISHTDKIVDLLILIGIKVLLALVCGYVTDLVVDLFAKARKNRKKEAQEIHEEHSHEEEHHEHHHECGHIHTDKCDHECGHSHDCCADNIFIDACKHTFEIALYIFVATFVINLILGYCDLSAFEQFLQTNEYLQIVIAALVGLIPNCASSVLLVELFVSGILGFPALVAGLTAGAGVGLVILWTRNRKHILQNILISVLQYAIGISAGFILTLFM